MEAWPHTWGYQDAVSLTEHLWPAGACVGGGGGGVSGEARVEVTGGSPASQTPSPKATHVSSAAGGAQSG